MRHAWGLMATFLLTGCGPELTSTTTDVYWTTPEKLVAVNVYYYRNCSMGDIFSFGCDEPSGPFKVQFRLLQKDQTLLSSLTVPVTTFAPDESRGVLGDFSPVANSGNGFLIAAREAVITIDSDNEVAEGDETDNEARECINLHVPPYLLCWKIDYCFVDPSDIDLVVRTVNTIQGWSNYPGRLSGIDQLYKTDWPYQVGVIGMQEVKESTSCPTETGTVYGAECFSSILANDFGHATSWTQIGPVGIVSGSAWQMTSWDGWFLGKDSWKHFGNRSSRYLSEAVLQDQTHGWILRAYSTHLSHGDQLDQRHEQIDKLLDIIKNRPRQTGELPPILVGDFNFDPQNEPSSFNKLNADFRLINSDFLGCFNHNPKRVGIDQIWVGRHSTFSTSQGAFTPVRYHTSGDGKGIDLAGLSDHSSPGISFKISYP